MNCLMNTYKRFPVSFSSGLGMYLKDEKGGNYLDMLAGIAVNVVGHSHPVLVEAIKEQAGKIIHTSNLFSISPQEKLARYLADQSFGDKAFFSNSGAEANEAAFKLARRFQWKRGMPEKNVILSFEGSFHGRTLAALAATGQTKYHEGFAPLPGGFRTVPFRDEAALEAELSRGDVAAVIIEVIQGEGGVRPAGDEFMRKARGLTDRYDALLIIDEVQTGMGRTGSLFAYSHSGIIPDMMTLAKGLAGGIPIGALVARDEVAEAFEPGTHASTFGGNHLASTAAVTVFKIILGDLLVERARASGEFAFGMMKDLLDPLSAVKEIRGKGLMIGIELDRPAGPIIERLLFEERIIVGSAGEKVLRLTPPLIATSDHLTRALEAIERALKA